MSHTETDSILCKLERIDKWGRAVVELNSCNKSRKKELISKIREVENILDTMEGKRAKNTPLQGNTLTMKVDKDLFCYDSAGSPAQLYSFIGKNIRVEYVVKYFSGEFGNGVFVRMKNIKGL